MITRPPTASGIHISAPVRPRLLPPIVEVELPVEPVLELVLELVLLFVLELVLEFVCADATLASDSVITTARSAPATSRRAINPVVRTLSLSPNAF